MSMTDRDRKIMIFLVPVIVVLAYWFLLLTPKREEAKTAADNLTVQEQRRDVARQRVTALEGSRTDFAADYAELVRLGKAVPEEVDMPTLLVQLESAANGTDISFISIATEEREAAEEPAPPPPAAPGEGDGSQPAAAGGAPAQSGEGTAAEATGDAVTAANANNTAAAEQSGVDPADTQTSQTAREGGLPVGGGTATPGVPGAPATTTAPALDTVPITLEFTGNFFNLASFFHRLKRYVELSQDDLYVRGRLITIDGIEFLSEADTFPKIRAEVTATAYLAPASQGTTAGATPGGPAVTPAADPTAVPPVVPPTPTATATP
jgi:Tfp pilus assembly protein PilO